MRARWAGSMRSTDQTEPAQLAILGGRGQASSLPPVLSLLANLELTEELLDHVLHTVVAALVLYEPQSQLAEHGVIAAPSLIRLRLQHLKALDQLRSYAYGSVWGW